VPLNHGERKWVQVLRRREAWLTARVAIEGDHLTYDRHERAALQFALRCIEGLYPDTVAVAYNGQIDGKYSWERPQQPEGATKGVVAKP
jgi:hypothetical protein